MLFKENENNILPFSNLPYGFKSRLIQLARIDDATKINTAFPGNNVPRYRQHQFYYDVYITDADDVLQLASKRASSYPHWYFIEYLLDGAFSIDPTWQSALFVNTIVEKNELLCINNTLVLNLESVESYDRVVPLIVGSHYRRLVLHGQFTWVQVKRLINSNVKQVRLMNRITVKPKEYDDVVQFVVRFNRDFKNKFTVHEDCFSPELMVKLNEAFQHHETHSIVSPFFERGHYTHFNPNGYWLPYCLFNCCFSIIPALLVLFLLAIFVPNILENGAEELGETLMLVPFLIFMKCLKFKPKDVTMFLPGDNNDLV